LERLATRADNIGNITKRSIIAGDLNLLTLIGTETWNICKYIGVGKWVHAGSKEPDPRGCIAGCICSPAGKLVHPLQRYRGGQWPLWGVIRSRIGRKILSADSRKASTGVPQSRYHGATNFSPG
jgi:hypothetical protein